MLSLKYTALNNDEESGICGRLEANVNAGQPMTGFAAISRPACGILNSRLTKPTRLGDVRLKT